MTEELSDNAVKFIEDNSSDPFFLYLSYNAPHTPLQATAMDLERNNHIEVEKRRTYAAMVSSMDDGIGLILDKLEEKKITDNTIVIFFSDNGGVEWYNFSDNGILRGIKGDFYEGGIRVPFFFHWKGIIKSGINTKTSISHLDIFPTIIDAIGDNNFDDEFDAWLDSSAVIWAAHNCFGTDAERILKVQHWMCPCAVWCIAFWFHLCSWVGRCQHTT